MENKLILRITLSGNKYLVFIKLEVQPGSKNKHLLYHFYLWTHRQKQKQVRRMIPKHSKNKHAPIVITMMTKVQEFIQDDSNCRFNIKHITFITKKLKKQKQNLNTQINPPQRKVFTSYKHGHYLLVHAPTNLVYDVHKKYYSNTFHFNKTNL